MHKIQRLAGKMGMTQGRFLFYQNSGCPFRPASDNELTLSRSSGGAIPQDCAFIRNGRSRRPSPVSRRDLSLRCELG